MPEIGKMIGRALIDNTSINEDDRTVEVVFATETPVFRYGWEENFNEVLLCTEANVRMDRFKAGVVPALNNHDRVSGLESQLGTCFDPTFGNGEIRCKIKVSKREDVNGVWQDIKDGIIKGISVGYRVYKYEKITNENSTELPTYRAIDWEVMEISFAPVPADSNSSVRKDESKYSVELIDKTKKMENNNQPDTTTRQDSGAPSFTEDQKRAAEKDGVAIERKRVSDITSAIRAAGLENDIADKAISEGKSIEDVRALIIEKLIEKQSKVETSSHQRASVNVDETDKVRSAMEGALSHRAGLDKDLKAGSEEFRNMSLLRMAEDLLSRQGEKVNGLSARQIATRALSTSDFPIILGNTVNRQLRAAYELAPRTFMPFCRRGTVSDFKEVTKAQLSGIVDSFDEVKEGGEYQNSKMTEAAEKLKVAKYGKIIPITWETLVNDDLSAFTRIPTAIAAKAAQKQSDIVWGIITGNPNMSDGKALFHADHGNLTASGTAISSDSLSVARALLRKQKGLEDDYLNLQGRYLIVGPDKETEAQKLLQAVIVATKTSDTNVFKGSMELIVEPRLTGNQWYVACEPTMVDTIEYAFLDGEGELFTETERGFDIDGMRIKARMVFGAKAIDYRGLYKNVGA